MQRIQNVGILGAGAMGAMFAQVFSANSDFSTYLIADGSRADRLKKEGLKINGKNFYFQVAEPDHHPTKLDLIIVTLKHFQLAEGLDLLPQMIGEETILVSFMNGLVSEEIIASRFGWDKVLYGVTVGIDAVREGNTIVYSKPGKQIFGEANNASHSPKVARVVQAFETAGIQYVVPVDMLRMLWWKFMVNVGVNQASAVLRAPYRVFHTNANAQALMNDLMQEVVNLARACQVDLTDQDILNWYPVLKSLSPEGKTSMLQDVEAGRKTEVEVFGEEVVLLGTQNGIPTPVNQTIVNIIKTIEATYS